MNIYKTLDSREAEIKDLQAQLEQELKDILAAKAALSPPTDKEQTFKLGRGRGSKFTVQDMVINVLLDYNKGADVFQIIKLIKSKYGIDIKRESLSPRLSRLKNNDKLLELRGSYWFLIPQRKP